MVKKEEDGRESDGKQARIKRMKISEGNKNDEKE